MVIDGVHSNNFKTKGYHGHLSDEEQFSLAEQSFDVADQVKDNTATESLKHHGIKEVILGLQNRGVKLKCT